MKSANFCFVLFLLYKEKMLTDKANKSQINVEIEEPSIKYFACLSVRLYPINVKTAELIGPHIF